MQRVLALVAFALIFLWAVPAGAAILQVDGVDDCWVYSWQDAVDRAWHRIHPHKALYPAENGAWVLEERRRWADGAPPGKENAGEAMIQEIYWLLERGVPESVFQGLKIYVLPCWSMEFDGFEAVGLARWDAKEVYVAGHYCRRRNAFLHEIGHVVQYTLLGVPDYGWTAANEKGREYLRMRGYDKPLRHRCQERLPWGERASELFAEDFKWWAGKVSHHPFIAADPPDLKVMFFFDRLFADLVSEQKKGEVVCASNLIDGTSR